MTDDRSPTGLVVPPSGYPSDIPFTDDGEGMVLRPGSDGVDINWSFPDGRRVYVPFRVSVAVHEVSEAGLLYLRPMINTTASIGLNVSWADSVGARIPGVTYAIDAISRITVPPDAVEAILFLTLQGQGTATIRSVTLWPRNPQPPVAIDASMPKTLVVTDAYPSDEDLYRNAFVHTRVRGYRRQGHDVMVYVMHGQADVRHREFDGVRVIVGDQAALRDLLDTGHFTHILVHFLNGSMWKVLRNVRGRIPIAIWLHGSDSQPYWRREFVYRNRDERDSAITASDARMALWRDVAASDPADITFVYVSTSFRDENLADQSSLGFRLDSGAVRVINNPVDTELFSYVEKDLEQRKRILLIRPFASRKYANDLANSAIRQLSDEPWFGELSFRLIGDGPLFEEDTAGLDRYPNVVVERRFLPQTAIAALHKEWGVFLVPTRHDTQGVSRDEAMSSGLVPITNDVPASREFLSEREGYLARYDDAGGLADAIRDLYHHPEIFAAKSRAAAERIRRTVASSIVIPQEIELFAAERPGRHRRHRRARA